MSTTACRLPCWQLTQRGSSRLRAVDSTVLLMHLAIPVFFVASVVWLSRYVFWCICPVNPSPGSGRLSSHTPCLLYCACRLHRAKQSILLLCAARIRGCVGSYFWRLPGTHRQCLSPAWIKGRWLPSLSRAAGYPAMATQSGSLAQFRQHQLKAHQLIAAGLRFDGQDRKVMG